MEAARTSAELRSQAMTNQLLVINGVFRATDRNDPLAVAIERRGVEALSHISEEVASYRGQKYLCVAATSSDSTN